MSQRIADASAKVARPSYPLPRRRTTSFPASLGQLAELSGELVPHLNIVKSFQFYSARQHADQALPDAHKPYFVALLIPTIAMLCDLYRPPPLIGSTR
jgi:hypothetical protein